jgi:hypothetical protein
VCSTSGTLGPAPVPAEGWMAKAEGLAGSGASGGVDAWSVVASAPADRVLTMRSWILPRGGRQTVGGNRARRWTPTQPPDDSSPLRREAAGGPPRKRTENLKTYCLHSPTDSTLQLFLRCYFYCHETRKEIRRLLTNRKPKDLQEPSVLSSHYCVSVSLQGVHYL